MIGLEAVRKMALALPGAAEEPHFELTSFRVRGRIFATAPDDGSWLNVFIDPADADGYVAEDPQALEPLWWGQRVRGIRVRLASAAPDRTAELLTEAWRRKAPKRLVAEFDSAD